MVCTLYSAGCRHGRGGGGVTDRRLRGINVEGNTERYQTFTEMLRTYHIASNCITMLFLWSLSEEKKALLSQVHVFPNKLKFILNILIF